MKYFNLIAFSFLSAFILFSSVSSASSFGHYRDNNSLEDSSDEEWNTHPAPQKMDIESSEDSEDDIDEKKACGEKRRYEQSDLPSGKQKKNQYQDVKVEECFEYELTKALKAMGDLSLEFPMFKKLDLTRLGAIFKYEELEFHQEEWEELIGEVYKDATVKQLNEIYDFIEDFIKIKKNAEQEGIEIDAFETEISDVTKAFISCTTKTHEQKIACLNMILRTVKAKQLHYDFFYPSSYFGLLLRAPLGQEEAIFQKATGSYLDYLDERYGKGGHDLTDPWALGVMDDYLPGFVEAEMELKKQGQEHRQGNSNI